MGETSLEFGCAAYVYVFTGRLLHFLFICILYLTVLIVTVLLDADLYGQTSAFLYIIFILIDVLPDAD